jgi:hypothetical protein
MSHQSNTGNAIIDIAVNATIWILVVLHKTLAGFIVFWTSIIFKNKMTINLSNLNEVLHTVALLLAIIVSLATIVKLIRNQLKKKK